MPDLTTDPELMREQQDKDTPQSIARHETAGGDVSDSDAASASDRQAAKTGKAPHDDKQMTAVFEGNKPERATEGDRPRQQADANLADNSRRSEKGEQGLANSGRSRLGD